MKLLKNIVSLIILLTFSVNMEAQEKSIDSLLESFIENWKAETEQVDDILLIGIRL